MTTSGSEIFIYKRDKLLVSVALRCGDLVTAGQDLSGSEYEYWLTVRAADVPRVTAALGGTPGSDVLALVQANAETIVRTGEKSWLDAHGIPTEFWSWSSPASGD